MVYYGVIVCLAGRFCVSVLLRVRNVVCDGLCRVSFSVVRSSKICPVWQEAFDSAVNCEASENP